MADQSFHQPPLDIVDRLRCMSFVVCVEAAVEIERLRAALESIAANTCCDGCREAALVAKAALAKTTKLEPENE